MALERERQVHFATTLCIVNAIMEVGNRVVAAMSDTPASQLNGDVVKKSIQALQELLVPEEAERTERKAKEAKEKLAKEASRGPIKFRTQSQSGNKGRRKRR